MNQWRSFGPVYEGPSVEGPSAEGAKPLRGHAPRKFLKSRVSEMPFPALVRKRHITCQNLQFV